MKLSDIGPGLLLAATGIGVGDMVSSTIAGAEYGLTLVWALAAGVVLKYAITEGAARWQLGTGSTLVEGWRDHLPRAAPDLLRDPVGNLGDRVQLEVEVLAA